MDVDFRVRGFAGRVRVACAPNDDPLRWGWGILAPGTAHLVEGFPVCTATVEYEGEGYAGLFGWTQLVKSSDNRSQGRAFEMDPFSLYVDIPTPFAWFGLTPTLFDAPARHERKPLQWLAHSFLCFTSEPAIKEVRAVLGFGWGFEIDADGAISVQPIHLLRPEAWNQHLHVLRAEYQHWSFLEGFHER